MKTFKLMRGYSFVVYVAYVADDLITQDGIVDESMGLMEVMIRQLLKRFNLSWHSLQ